MTLQRASRLLLQLTPNLLASPRLASPCLASHGRGQRLWETAGFHPHGFQTQIVFAVCPPSVRRLLVGWSLGCSSRSQAHTSQAGLSGGNLKSQPLTFDLKRMTNHVTLYVPFSSPWASRWLTHKKRVTGKNSSVSHVVSEWVEGFLQ